MVHWFDIFIVVFCLVLALWSYFRGLLKEAFAIGAMIAGYMAASRYYETLAGLAKPHIQEQLIREGAAFAVLFIGAGLIVVVIGSLLRRALRSSDILGTTDRIAGACVGVFKALLLVTIFIYPLTLFPELENDLASQSKTGPVFLGASAALMEWMAPGLATAIEKTVGESKAARRRAKAVDSVKKKIKQMEKDLGEKAKNLKNSLGLAGKNGGQDTKPDEISEDDRKELETIIEKAD